jgi:signal peptidase I
MKTKALLLILLTVFVSAHLIKAQDQIHKKTKEVIHCKVKEIGIDEINYQLPVPDNEILYSISKDQVSRVVLEDGEEIVFKDNFKNPENYVDNKKNALKIEFLSPLTGNTSFSYERCIQPGRSFEVTLGLIGLGTDPNNYNQTGFFSKGGLKFLKSPDFYLRGMRYAHILKGSYVKPEIAFGYYSRNFDDYDYHSETRDDVISGAIFLNFGKQWIYDNSFLVDLYFGFGYGFDSGPNDGGYHYGYLVGAGNFPMAVQGGLKIGFLFK